MNEKKPIKISLSTFFLVLAIIVIIVMGIYIYIISVEKIKEEEKVEILNSEVTELEGTVNNLQGKIDSIANTVNSNTSNNTTSSEQVNDNTSANTSNSNEVTHLGTYKKSKNINVDDSQMPDYIVLKENAFYLCNSLTSNDTGLQGTYEKDSKNNIYFNYSSQDYAFFSAASAKVETLNGKINIILENGNEIMHFEKID